MSSLPQQPYDSPPQSAGTKRGIRAILAAVVLLAAIIGLYLLGVNYGRAVSPAQPIVFASPTSSVVAVSQGVNGTATPQLTATALPIEAAPATRSPGVEARATTTSQTEKPAEATIRTLDEVGVPARDLYALTARLKNKSAAPIPRTTDRLAGNYQVGQSEVFYMNDVAGRRYYTVTATVREVSEHAYWYAQNDSSVDEAALKRVVNAFEKNIYPKNRTLFGSEWTPGVDNDPRITVLFASISGAGGYFSSADEYTRNINPFSNEREIIYISTDGGWGGVESTLAHEFQHMIHWHEHPNHDVWLNEGAAVLASALNGYSVGVDSAFMKDADVQLNAWRSSPSEALANYGASFLFLEYLRSHYGGEKIIRSVVSAEGQGAEAIDNALAGLGHKETFADVFQQWVVANLVDEQPGSGRSQWHYPERQVQASPQQVIDSYPSSYSGQVSQFGTDYIELQPPTSGESLRVEFSGQAETRIIPAAAHSGSRLWWSNRGDLSNMTMTRRFDLRGHSSATLNFYTWFDIEEGFDYGYVEASTDGGATWDTLKGAYTTNDNPNGTNFGNGYTGKSAENKAANKDGWLRESIDLGAYAGKEIMVRFEYITDDGYNAQGMAIDDVSIPELGYTEDAEGSDGGWESAGFVRVYNSLPQRYYVAAVKFKADGFEVQPVEVGPLGKASFQIEGLGAGGGYQRAVLVIAGLTPHTLQPSAYELSIRP